MSLALKSQFLLNFEFYKNCKMCIEKVAGKLTYQQHFLFKSFNFPKRLNSNSMFNTRSIKLGHFGIFDMLFLFLASSFYQDHFHDWQGHVTLSYKEPTGSRSSIFIHACLLVKPFLGVFLAFLVDIERHSNNTTSDKGYPEEPRKNLDCPWREASLYVFHAFWRRTTVGLAKFELLAA